MYSDSSQSIFSLIPGGRFLQPVKISGKPILNRYSHGTIGNLFLKQVNYKSQSGYKRTSGFREARRLGFKYP